MKAIPEDFAENVKQGKTLLELAGMYGVNDALISKWKQKAGLTGINSKSAFQVPPSFIDDVRADMSRFELAVKYGISESTVGTWKRKAGLIGVASKNAWKGKELLRTTTRSTEERKQVEPEELTPEEYQCWLHEAANPTSAQLLWRRTLTPGKRETVRRLKRGATPRRWQPALGGNCTLHRQHRSRAVSGR